ncbi:MAG: nucleotidyltransferase [Methylophaga sp.]|nr:MAG: nucleotidyltransferase [Methylophaga sp.]
MSLDYSSLENAIKRLKEGLNAIDKNPENSLYRDAVIQRFEFTYELSHKMLKRYLEETMANPQEVDDMTFQNLIRTGSEKSLLLSGWDIWRDYRNARSITSHTYDEEKAKEVLLVIPAFYNEAKYLIEKLNDESS